MTSLPSQPAGSLTLSQRRRGLTAVLMGMLVIGVNVGLFNPLIALNLEAQGVSTTFNGINAAMPFIAAILFAPLVPMLTRRMSLLGVLLLSGGFDVVVILAFTLSDDTWVWLGLRFLMGIGMLFHWVSSEIWVNAATTDANRGKIIGINGALFSAGMICGPLVLGEVGTSGNLPFFISAVLVVAAMSPLLFAFGTAPDASSDHKTNLLAAVRKAPTPMLGALVEGILFVALFVQLPIYGVRSGLIEGDAISLLSALVIGGTIAPIGIGWLADHVNRRLLLLACGATCFVAILLLPFVLHSTVLTWALLMVWGGAGTGFYTVGLVRLGQLFGPSQLSAATAAFVMTTHIGSIIGPVIAGIGMDLWNPNGFIAAMAASALAFLVFGTWRYLTAPDPARRIEKQA
ncbi:MAG: MFS transporter [Alphaproteobacteria bacterium]|nr:MFS transporter [Rhodospirillaceae bacterium]MDG2482506.1 MFS transporter [Alphaproteobacteria bacterium]